MWLYGSMAQDKKSQPKVNTTKDFVEIAEIKDSVVVLKDGSLRSVVEVGSMNFELKSLDEQTAIITAFQDFLNSIDFSLQIVINSRRLDIKPYLNYLETLSQSIEHELLKIQAIEYSRFVKGLTELANIMSKKFYIVVPFTIIAAPKSKKGIMESFRSIVSPTTFTKSLTDEEFKTYKTQLDQRVDLTISGIGRLGIETTVLSKNELVNLYKSSYNPGQG